jgi:hypothetical protein
LVTPNKYNHFVAVSSVASGWFDNLIEPGKQSILPFWLVYCIYNIFKLLGTIYNHSRKVMCVFFKEKNIVIRFCGAMFMLSGAILITIKGQ